MMHLVSLLMTACSFLMMPVSVEAGCKSPEFGPPGPPGPAGPPGTSNISDSFASSFSTGEMSIVDNPYPIMFDQDQTAPLNIIHPVGGNFSQFQILSSGLYAVSWTFSIFDFDGEPAASVILANVTGGSPGVPIPPSPFSQQTIPVEELGYRQTISGQTLVRLNAGTIIELQVGYDSGLQIFSPSIYLARIAP